MSNEQVLDKGIRQKSTKRVNSFIVCSAFSLEPLNRDPMDSEKQLRVYTSGCSMACHVWRVDKVPGHIHKIGSPLIILSMGKVFACTYGIRSKLVNNTKYHAWSVESLQNLFPIQSQKNSLFYQVHPPEIIYPVVFINNTNYHAWSAESLQEYIPYRAKLLIPLSGSSSG